MEITNYTMSKNFAKKLNYNVLGIMTGTSMDGIDFSFIKSNGKNYVKILNEKSYNYSLINQKKIKNIVETKPQDRKKIKERFQKCENEITNIYISYIKRFIKEFKMNINQIDIISLSGQTVYHNPRDGVTIQLGSAKIISNKFKIKTVSDLRKNDIKYGG